MHWGHWPPDQHTMFGKLITVSPEALKMDVKPYPQIHMGPRRPMGKNLNPNFKWTQIHIRMEVPKEVEHRMGPLVSGGKTVHEGEDAKEFWRRSLA